MPGAIQACPELHQASRIIVGFSGGLDSTVLLHALFAAQCNGALAGTLHALHVNHAMQPDAERWVEHCRTVCAALDVPFDAVRVPVVSLPGESLEETARNARHEVFASTLSASDVLVLAQHRDDQVETVMFRLLRGSGAAGLAGMPRSRACGAGLLLRPLLDVPRANLLSYAKAHGLQWIEDGSNADPRFDRNYLRSTVMPLLYARWPGLAGTVTRSAQLAGEAAELLDDLAIDDLGMNPDAVPSQLAFAPLLQLSEARQRNALRYWLQTWCAQRSLALPTHQALARAIPEVACAASDAEPLLCWGAGNEAVELRRHRGMLHVLAALSPPPTALEWDTREPLALPAPLGTLQLTDSEGKGIPCSRLAELRVGFRSGGERVKPAGRPTRPLKKLLQEAGVPPWLREHVPLLYAGNELVAVADLLVCEGWLADASENTCRIVWQHPDLDCGYPPHLLI